jgi:hypothetical protein
MVPLFGLPDAALAAQGITIKEPEREEVCDEVLESIFAGWRYVGANRGYSPRG